MKSEMWKLMYISRLIKAGIDRENAEANFDAGDHDFTEDPIDAADDELSYISEDW